MQSPSVWNDLEKVKRLKKEKSVLEKAIKEWKSIDEKVEEIKILIELFEEENDLDLEKETVQKLQCLITEMKEIELRETLKGEHDRGNAIVSIHAGAGGTEAQDWAQMLLRMYMRWAEKKGFKCEILDILPGEEAGIKSVTFSVVGDYAFGYLRSEAGIHRLVRISPFDANRRRHTSFAAVFVYPDIEEETEIVIDESDLKIETFRAGGPGGQHVNKTESAVRITHIPTGIVVQCQNERSQHRNKAMAMKILKARLYELEERKRAEKLKELHEGKKEIAWGSQIRSYILQPYQLVKDHRTGYEVGDVESVLDGELDGFIQAWILRNISELKPS